MARTKVADTSTVFDTNGGEIRYSGKVVRDSHKGLRKNISSARFELSSNTVMVKAVYDNYKNNPKSLSIILIHTVSTKTEHGL
jgi:cell division protein FtsI (penicillin-binding protein 3)